MHGDSRIIIAYIFYIVVCGLLPRDVNWSVNRIYINEINDYLSYKCSLNDFNFVKPKD